ncbi:MAG: polysaccharide pyruvyl transferase family protein, partial [Syntrophobacteraceae bacterium]
MILALRLRRSDAEHYWKVKELKIGLLTPYTGGNFGDAAIQEAVIGNIRKRLPEALIYHITLCPEKTSELHGIPSFPITPLAIRNYAPGRSTQVRRGDRTGTFVAGKCDILSWVKSTVKGFPLLFSFLKKGQELFASLNLMPRQIYYEIQYLVAAYRFMEGFSLLVVAGGGQLDDYWGGPMGHPYSLFRWAILTKLTGAKLIFLSVGTCSLDSRLSRFFVKHALKHAWYRSYRDHTSKKLLAAMPFTFGDPVLPDLAFSYDPKWIDATVPSTRRDNVIGISPIAYLSYHWPKQRESVYTHYIQQLATFCSNLVHEGYSIVIFVSDTRDVRAVNALV